MNPSTGLDRTPDAGQTIELWFRTALPEESGSAFNLDDVTLLSSR